MERAFEVAFSNKIIKSIEAVIREHKLDLVISETLASESFATLPPDWSYAIKTKYYEDRVDLFCF